jgi:hypothetical protein
MDPLRRVRLCPVARPGLLIAVWPGAAASSVFLARILSSDHSTISSEGRIDGTRSANPLPSKADRQGSRTGDRRRTLPKRSVRERRDCDGQRRHIEDAVAPTAASSERRLRWLRLRVVSAVGWLTCFPGTGLHLDDARPALPAPRHADELLFLPQQQRVLRAVEASRRA